MAGETYVKRYGAGFVDLPAQTTAVDSQFLNAVEAALLRLLGEDPAADEVGVWTPGSNRFVFQKLTNAQIDAAAAIAKSKLAALNIADADVASGADIAVSKLDNPGDNALVLLGDGTWGAQGVGASDGWISVADTWTYASWSAPAGTFTVSGDKTSTLQPGRKIKLTQSASIRFFIITKSSFSAGTTTVTVYGGTDYTLANAAISSPAYSLAQAPVDFPRDPTKWTVALTDTTDRSQGSPTMNTWYNQGSLQIAIPIGAWKVRAKFVVFTDNAGSAPGVHGALSTSASSVSDAELQGAFYGRSQDLLGGTITLDKDLVLASATTYFVISRTVLNAGSTLKLYNSTGGALTVRAISAYL